MSRRNLLRLQYPIALHRHEYQLPGLLLNYPDFILIRVVSGLDGLKWKNLRLTLVSVLYFNDRHQQGTYLIFNKSNVLKVDVVFFAL